MYLEKLVLSNFKNYTEADLDFCNKINCFVGENGEGKTNLLDAIHYLSFCKSYFNNIDSQNILYDSGFFSIHGTFQRKQNLTPDPSPIGEGKSDTQEALVTNERQQGEQESLGANERQQDTVHCVLKRNQKKQFKLNKKEYERLSDHIGLIPLVMISPSDSNMIYNGSEERRRYIDGVISQFDKQYLHDLISYNKALEQRNKLLKQFAENRIFENSSLEIWDEQLIKYGNNIFQKRVEFIENIIPIFQEYYKFITGNKESVSLEYDSQLNVSHLQNVKHFPNFRQLLKDVLSKDMAVQYTTVGLHKDDILFKIGDYPVKKFGSQGQQKSFIIAIKLAQFAYTKKMKGYKPILLFDDLFDKLDDSRVEKLIELVSSSMFGQIFITETHKDRILRIFKNADIEKKIYEIKKGKPFLLITND